MITETYELKEVSTESPEQSAEAIALCESLGLKGQLSTMVVDAPVKTRFPYRLMTDEEHFVYSVLCPQKDRVEAYSNEPIPLEVLKTLAFAKTFTQFQRFEVWAASSRTVKDPVLVGFDSTWGGKAYILARWGDELLPLEVLIPDALNRWWKARKDKLNEMKAEIDQAINRPCPSSCPASASLPYHFL